MALQQEPMFCFEFSTLGVHLRAIITLSGVWVRRLQLASWNILCEQVVFCATYPTLACILLRNIPFLNCAVDSLHDFEIAYAISKSAHNLAIDRMCNAILKLCKLPKYVEHIRLHN